MSTKKRDVVLSLCDYTGVMAAPWVAAGYSVILVDPQHPEGVTVDGAITRVGRVIAHDETQALITCVVEQGRVAFVASFPPCTDLAVSGARWFQEKATRNSSFQEDAMGVVHSCRVVGELSGAPWFIENPVSRISTLWRKPDHTFHPWHYAGWCADDNYTKRTCLWVGGGFRMPPPHRCASRVPPDNRMHRMAPGPERANMRSKTPLGFARAVFLANAMPCAAPA